LNEPMVASGSFTAKTIPGLLERGMERQAQRYKIHKVLRQCHSALKHTFLWIVDADEPHLTEQFCVDEHVASFNELRIVPLITFKEVAEGIRRIHAR
jgi:hypothetical protein